jgi:hypothetical protein
VYKRDVVLYILLYVYMFLLTKNCFFTQPNFIYVLQDNREIDVPFKMIIENFIETLRLERNYFSILIQCLPPPLSCQPWKGFTKTNLAL